MRRVLTIMDRAGIAKGLGEGHSLREIARRVGRDVSVVSREVARNRGKGGLNRPGFGSDPVEGELEHAQEVQSRVA
mgnify:CR=1 FL=1